MKITPNHESDTIWTFSEEIDAKKYYDGKTPSEYEMYAYGQSEDSKPS